MSLSLAAYGLMVGGVILVLIDKRKYIAMAAMAAVFVLIGVGAASYLNGENVLNQAIVSRLEVTEDGEIAGNNRYTTFFKDTFKKYLKSDRIWFGAGRDAVYVVQVIRLSDSVCHFQSYQGLPYEGDVDVSFSDRYPDIVL